MLSTSTNILFNTQRISPDGIDARSDCPFGLEEDEHGSVFGVEGHEGAISDHFVGANEFTDHGRPGTRVELMVDSGSTATVCGLEHFSDTPVTIGPPKRLRARW